MSAGFEGSFVFRHSLVEFVFVAGVIRYSTAEGVKQLLDYVDVQRLVVRLSVRAVRSIVEIKCDIEIVDDFQVGLYSDIESVVLEMTGNVFPNSFGLWSRDVFEYGKSVVSVQTNAFFSVGVT